VTFTPANTDNYQTVSTNVPVVVARYYTQDEYDSFGALQFSNGQRSVTTDPAAFSLYTESQFAANRVAGQADVISNPTAYSLFRESSIMDLRMGGLMIQKQGTSATVSFQPQTTTDLASIPFADNGLPITKTFEMPEDKHFLRIQALATASDQMVAVQGGMLPQSSQLAGTVVETFHIGKYEVTWAEWQEVRAWAVVNGYPDLEGVGAGSSSNHPVRFVSWYDVAKWINAKSEKEGLTPVYFVNGEVLRTGDPNYMKAVFTGDGNGYRLPTEVEWEWAARGGVSSQGYTYSGSNDANAVAWYSNNSSGGTEAVGTKAANELGIHDMSGNVWEWCEDIVNVYYESDRRIRGGNWLNGLDECAVAYRHGYGFWIDARFEDVGFRLARGLGL
jgi:formylglycine-generating enzyme required for sulfatase activity